MRSYKKNSGRRLRGPEAAEASCSTCGVSSSGGTSDQLAEDGGNLVEVGGLVQEIVCACGKALVAVLGVCEVCTNQDLKPGMPSPDRPKHIETRATRHLQIKNHG